MKKAFTLLELLVASLLLSMLVTILTMLFNQSSIAWRTGTAGVADLDDVRDNIAEVREEADNAYVWNNQVQRIVGLWDEKGQLRERAWNVEGEQGALTGVAFVNRMNDSSKLSDFRDISVGCGYSGGKIKTYTVNVKSAGPDREFDTWDDIWSYPDEIN